MTKIRQWNIQRDAFYIYRLILTAAHCLCNEHFPCKPSPLNNNGLITDYDPLGKIVVRVGLTGIHRNLKIGERDENKNEYQVHKAYQNALLTW